MSATFMAAGPKIREHKTVARVRNIDVAPTIMHLLGVRPGAVDGRVPTAAVELRFEDDAVSVLARAEAALAQAQVESGAGSSWSAAVEPGG